MDGPSRGGSRMGLTAVMVWAEAPVEGFYIGSFVTTRGVLTSDPAPDLVAIGERLTRQVVDDLDAKLRWAGVKPWWMHACRSDIVWHVDICPASIVVPDD